MKWFSPLINDLKQTRTCGHAFERSITFFSTVKNKKLLLTNGLLKHIQMDSSKTQGHFVNQSELLDKIVNNII